MTPVGHCLGVSAQLWLTEASKPIAIPAVKSSWVDQKYLVEKGHQMKAVEIGSMVRVKNLGVRGIVESVDTDGFCWLKVESFPGRLGLPATELKANDHRYGSSVAVGPWRPSMLPSHTRIG